MYLHSLVLPWRRKQSPLIQENQENHIVLRRFTSYFMVKVTIQSNYNVGRSEFMIPHQYLTLVSVFLLQPVLS